MWKMLQIIYFELQQTLWNINLFLKIHLSISIFEEMTPVIAGFANVHLSVRWEGLFIIQKKVI